MSNHKERQHEKIDALLNATKWYTCANCALFGFCRGLDNGEGWCRNYSERGGRVIMSARKQHVAREKAAHDEKKKQDNAK